MVLTVREKTYQHMFWSTPLNALHLFSANTRPGHRSWNAVKYISYTLVASEEGYTIYSHELKDNYRVN